MATDPRSGFDRRLGRRELLLAGAGVLATTPFWPGLFGRLRNESLFVSACDDGRGQHLIAGFDTRRGLRFRIPVDQRCHEPVRDPVSPERVVVVARRPGTKLYDVDIAAGKLLRVVESPLGRHVYGHACFTRDGRALYVSENDFARGRGVIGIYDGHDLQRIGEISSHGVGPHELRLLSDGTTLLVANGGIRTHPERGREKLNLATMEPNLAYLDPKTDTMVGVYRLEDRHAGMRHVDVAPDDSVAIAIQYEGSLPSPHPLVAFHRGEDHLRLAREAPAEFEGLAGYAASVCLSSDGRSAALTCPRADRVVLFDVPSGRIDRVHQMGDAGGVARADDGESFVVTTGHGYVHLIPADGLDSAGRAFFDRTRWDNHVTRVMVGPA